MAHTAIMAAVGTYSYLSVGGYDILSTKGGFEPAALTIFDEDDRVDVPAYHYNGEEDRGEDDDGEDVGFPIGFEDPASGCRYRASVAVIRDRLDTMGFTRARAEGVLLQTTAARARYLSDEDMPEQWLPEKELCERLTFADWVAAFRDLKLNGIYEWNLGDEIAHPTGLDPDVVQSVMSRDSALFDYLLDDNAYPQRRYAFPPNDFRTFLRAAIEACADDEIVEYDLAALGHGGYYPAGERLASAARDSLVADFPSNAPIIVLTEGPSDIAAIEKAMRILVPHLRSYFSFLDFSAAAARGGATALMELVKAFVGARLANRVIALFDNDAAGREAIRSLAYITLPSNIRVLLLPDLAFANSYPTIGPSGPSNDNVNRRAASIELYFGRDVLSDSTTGAFMPVRWAGYMAGVGDYQGELSDKRAVQIKFADKAEATLGDPSLRPTQDWTGMATIIDALRCAFH
jgi:hypothetical protein